MTTPEATLADVLEEGIVYTSQSHDRAVTVLTLSTARNMVRLLHDAGYALTPLAPEVPPRWDGLRARGVPMPGPNNRDELDRLTQNRETGAATPEPPDSGDGLSNHAETSAWQRPVSWAEAEADPAVRVVLREGLADLEAGRVRPLPPDSGDGAALREALTEWPGRNEIERMSDAEINHFLAARGLGVRVVERDAGIDAALLARALHDVLMRTSFSAWVGADPPYAYEISRRIAAEYARLRSGSPAPEGGE